MRLTVFRIAPEHQGKHECDGCDKPMDTHAIVCWVDDETIVYGHLDCVNEKDFCTEYNGCDECGKVLGGEAILAFEGAGAARESVILHDSDECIKAYEVQGSLYRQRKLTVISVRKEVRCIP